MHEHVGSEPSGPDFGADSRVVGGLTVQGAGFGIIGHLMIGIVGAFIGSWLLPKPGIHLGVGIIRAIVNATIELLCSFFSYGLLEAALPIVDTELGGSRRCDAGPEMSKVEETQWRDCHLLFCFFRWA
jgi:uncharacterized membrane protein YeaQ/YmgE (transglycosylase-associated protein family)